MSNVFQLQGATFAGLAVILFATSPSLADDFRKLSDAQIKRLITGKFVGDEVHYRDHFVPGGKYEGVSMGRSFTGSWEVIDGELCLARLSEKPDCDEIWQSRKNPALIQLRKAWLSEGKEAFVFEK